MPSSLATVISHALGFSPRLPVSVCGTVTYSPRTKAFLVPWVQPVGSRRSSPGSLQTTTTGRSMVPAGHYPCFRRPTQRRPLRSQRTIRGAGILTCWPSPTLFSLGLGPTNPGKTSLTQETLGFWRMGFSPILSLLVPAFALPEARTRPRGRACISFRNAPLPLNA